MFNVQYFYIIIIFNNIKPICYVQGEQLKTDPPQLSLTCADCHLSSDFSTITRCFYYYWFIFVSQTLFVFQYSAFLCCVVLSKNGILFTDLIYFVQNNGCYCQSLWVFRIFKETWKMFADKFLNSSNITKSIKQELIHKWYITGSVKMK